MKRARGRLSRPLQRRQNPPPDNPPPPTGEKVGGVNVGPGVCGVHVGLTGIVGNVQCGIGLIGGHKKISGLCPHRTGLIVFVHCR